MNITQIFIKISEFNLFLVISRLDENKEMSIRHMLLCEFWATEINDGEQAPVHGLFLQTHCGLEEINKDVVGIDGFLFRDGTQKLKNARNARKMRLSRRKALSATGKRYKEHYRAQIDEVPKLIS